MMAVKRGALALGEAGLAGAAVEQSVSLGLAVATTDAQVVPPALTVVGTIRVLAAETSEILRHGDASMMR
jgi:hypothetical protein